MSDPAAVSKNVLAGLRDRLNRFRAWFDNHVADPVIARAAPAVDAHKRRLWRVGIGIAVLLMVFAAVGGAAWWLLTPDTRLVIVVARLSGDERDRWRNWAKDAIADSLGPRVIVREADEALPREASITGKDGERARDALAQAILQRRSGNVLVWGEVASDGASAQIFFVAWDGTTSRSSAHRYLSKTAFKVARDPDSAIGLAVATFAVAAARLPEGSPVSRRALLGVPEARLARAVAAAKNPERHGEIARAYAAALLLRANSRSGRAVYKQAIAVLRDAAKTLPPAWSSYDWISLNVSLADALDAVGGEEGPDYFREALAARQQVLNSFSPTQSPLDWATADMAYAATEQRLGDAIGDSGMEQAAIDSYRKALDVFTQADAPLDWADVQYQVGRALRELAWTTNNDASLDQAQAALRLALSERTADRSPIDRADTLAELSSVEFMLADDRKDRVLATASVTSAQEAIKMVSRAGTPLKWASYQISLGNALDSRAKLAKSAADFDASAAAFQNALAVFDATTSPNDYTWTLYDLAITLNDYGDLVHDPARLKQAIADFDQAIAVDQKFGYSSLVKAAQGNRASAVSDLATMEQQTGARRR